MTEIEALMQNLPIQIPSSPWEEFVESLTPASRQMLDPAIADIAPPECYWHLLICEDGEPPDLQKFAEVGSLRQAIMAAWPKVKMLNDDVVILVFFGIRAFMTKGEQPSLLHPDGVLIPLYDTEEPIELIEDGLVNKRDEPEITEAEYDDDDGDDYGEAYAATDEALAADDDDLEAFPTSESGSEDEVSEEEPD